MTSKKPAQNERSDSTENPSAPTRILGRAAVNQSLSFGADPEEGGFSLSFGEPSAPAPGKDGHVTLEEATPEQIAAQRDERAAQSRDTHAQVRRQLLRDNNDDAQE